MMTDGWKSFGGQRRRKKIMSRPAIRQNNWGIPSPVMANGSKAGAPIQITGRDNYQKYGGLLGIDLVSNPEKAATPEVGFRIAGLFWQRNGLNELADGEMFETITRRINGGLNGLEDRLKYYTRAKQVLGVPAARGLLEPESERDIPMLPEFTRGREVIDDELPVKDERKPRARRAKRAPVKPAQKKADKKTGVSKTRQHGKGKPKAAKRRK